MGSSAPRTRGPRGFERVHDASLYGNGVHTERLWWVGATWRLTRSAVRGIYCFDKVSVRSTCSLGVSKGYLRSPDLAYRGRETYVDRDGSARDVFVRRPRGYLCLTLPMLLLRRFRKRGAHMMELIVDVLD